MEGAKVQLGLAGPVTNNTFEAWGSSSAGSMTWHSSAVLNAWCTNSLFSVHNIPVALQ
jgi:hypothetical protein